MQGNNELFDELKKIKEKNMQQIKSQFGENSIVYSEQMKKEEIHNEENLNNIEPKLEENNIVNEDINQIESTIDIIKDDNIETQEVEKINVEDKFEQEISNTEQVEPENIINEEESQVEPIIEETKEDNQEKQQSKKNLNSSNSYFDGSMLDLMAWNALRIILTILTFGIGYSWGECLFQKYKMSHTVLNGKRLKFIGDGSELFVEQFKWNFLTLVTFGIYAFIVPIKRKRWIVSHICLDDEIKLDCESYFDGKLLGLIGTNILCLIIIMLSVGILYPLAACIKLRWLAKHSILNDGIVLFEGKAIGLFGNIIKWSFLTIITLGIYGLWVPIKILSWEVENTHLLVSSEN